MVVVFAARYCKNPLLLLLLLLFDFVVVCFVCSLGCLFQGPKKRLHTPGINLWTGGTHVEGRKRTGVFYLSFFLCSFLSNPLADKSIAAVCKAAAVLCVERFRSVDVDSGFLH